MKDIKNIAIVALALIVAIGGGFAAFGGDAEPTPVPVDGDQGPRGPRGPAGPSVVGPQGPAGSDGADAVVDFDELVDSVLDEIADREAPITYGFSGDDGDYSYGFVVENEETYIISARHFGSGDFDLSIEDEDGNVSTLIDSSGHLGYSDTRVLSEGEYLIRVSASGDWEVDIEEE